MSNVFLYRMPSGIPGAVNRASLAKVDAAILDAVNYPTSFAVPVVIDATSTNMRKVMAGDAAANIFGIYVRPFPTSNGSTVDGLGTATPPNAGIGSVLKSGYIDAKVNYGTCTKDSPVYVRTVAGAFATIGGFEAGADGTNSFVLPNAYWNGTADANGNAEIAYNL
jgi:hypothetical protein